MTTVLVCIAALLGYGFVFGLTFVLVYFLSHTLKLLAPAGGAIAVCYAISTQPSLSKFEICCLTGEVAAVAAFVTIQAVCLTRGLDEEASKW